MVAGEVSAAPAQHAHVLRRAAFGRWAAPRDLALSPASIARTALASSFLPIPFALFLSFQGVTGHG